MQSYTTVSEIYPSRFLKSSDIGDSDLVLTIESVVPEDLSSTDHIELKPVLYSKEITKGFVLNKTNVNTIAHLFGERIEQWIGKKITLYTTEVSFQGNQMKGIRVRGQPPR